LRGLRFGTGRLVRGAQHVLAHGARTAGSALSRTRLALARMGIAVRLSIAFAVVAVLAVTANLIAEHGIFVVQTETTERAAAPVVRPAVPIATPVALPAVPPAPVRAAPLPGPLLAALGRYDRAVERRAESAASEATSQLRMAADGLQAEVARFIASAREESGPPSPQIRQLAARLGAHRKHGADLVEAADRRRQLLSDYWERFERIDAQVKGSLDRNWKIFGRVIARQSLISLSRDLDDIRRDSARLGPAGAFDSATLLSLSASQEKFATALEKNARGLGRSQGAEWLEGLRREFAEVVATRTMLVMTDARGREIGKTLEQDAVDISALVRTVASLTAPVARGETISTPTGALADAAPTAASVGASARASTAAPAGSPLGASAGSPFGASARATAAAPATRIEANSTAPAAAPERTASPSTGATLTPATSRVTTTSVPRQRSERITIALVSGAVLTLLLVICIGTVRSIVVPIRRFIVTTGKLSRGESEARFERGGIRELDTLAVAFNDMASKLAAARTQMREYQSRLEERVDERTRQLQHLAEHDSLTGLPNRRQLLSYLQSALRKAARDATQVGVFFIDLDNFKNINDSMGHAFGDRVLQAIAQRLREATDAGGFAARLGGDEFTVIYEGADSVEEVCRIGGRIVCAFQKPLLIDSRELLVGISVGASVYPDHERDGEALLRAADSALFQAKTSGRSQLSLFNPAMLEAATLKFRIEQGLRRAVDRGEFELLFQPEVSFDSMGTNLVEALLRWRLPDGRNVSPAEFLAVAEETGLIMSISDWVLSSAIESAGRWHRGEWPGVRVAINVSARQLLDNRFVDRISELMKQHRLPAECIEIELTETVLQTGPATIETLRRLRELGIAIALDDFGTGYSSLASLEQLPLTRVKLDRSLIASIHTSPRSLAIARAIVGLCSSLGLAVTAEGIEKPEQLAVLLQFPALCLQGYLIAEPIRGESLPAVIAEMPQRLQSLLLSAPLAATSGYGVALAGTSCAGTGGSAATADVAAGATATA
jgi:diguanylate cyclase (GGDEF)-like protein